MDYNQVVPYIGMGLIGSIVLGGIYRAVKESKSGAPKDWAGYTHKAGGFTEEKKVGFLLNWFEVDPVGKYVLCKDGSLMSVIRFRGPDMDSSTKEELTIFMARLNQVIRGLGNGFSLYFDAQRHYADQYNRSQVDVPLVQMMDDDRKAYYESSSHYETDFYFVVCQEKMNDVEARVTDALFESPADEEVKVDKKKKAFELYEDFVKRFLDVRNQIVSMLEKILPEVHLLDEDETCTYLHNCVSPDRHFVRADHNLSLSDYVFDGTGLVGGSEMRIGDKYCMIVSPLSTFPPESAPGFLDALNRLNIEYRWVSRFICLGKVDADKELEQIEKNYNQTVVGFVSLMRQAIVKDGDMGEINQSALDNASDAATARKELNDDSVGFGYYTLTIQVMDKDKKRCKEKADAIREVLVQRGFSAQIEGMNSLECWWGSLPGHYRANIRRNLVHSLTFCHFLPLTAIWPGDERNKHLNGPALLYTDTQGFTPFRFNLHVGDVGHTLVVGPTGAGKSVLLNMLEAHFLKYPNSNVFVFDKAASSRALTLAVGGNFYNLAAEDNGQLSFQPLAGIDDENEMRWAQSWILNYLKSKQTSTFEIGPKEEDFVWKALLSLRSFDVEFRTISMFSTLVQDEKIRMALVPLTMAGAYGKLFDNNKDVSGKGRWQVYEMETLMNLPEAVPLTLDYLFHRIEQQISKAKGPSIMVMDECWLFLDNPIFAAKLKEYLKDMRKKNTSIVIATQNLSDIAKSTTLIDVVKEQCKSKIFLPNALALTDSAYKLYTEFNLNDQQIRLIQSAVPKQDYYYSSEKGNRLLQLALRRSEAAFVTATSKDDQAKINEILEEYPEILEGDNNKFIREWFDFKGMPEKWDEYVDSYIPANSF